MCFHALFLMAKWIGKSSSKLTSSFRISVLLSIISLKTASWSVMKYLLFVFLMMSFLVYFKRIINLPFSMTHVIGERHFNLQVTVAAKYAHNIIEMKTFILIIDFVWSLDLWKVRVQKQYLGKNSESELWALINEWCLNKYLENWSYQWQSSI